MDTGSVESKSSATAASRPPDLRFLFGSPWAFIALGFGAGLNPVWPGTTGSILGLVAALLLAQLSAVAQILIVGIAFAVGILACERAGSLLNEPDHSAIVWDEIVGMAATALLAPIGLQWMLASFIAFRTFDIIKPWPIRNVDRQLGNGLGVMLDDALAAIYATAAVAALYQIAPYLSS